MRAYRIRVDGFATPEVATKRNDGVYCISFRATLTAATPTVTLHFQPIFTLHS